MREEVDYKDTLKYNVNINTKRILHNMTTLIQNIISYMKRTYLSISLNYLTELCLEAYVLSLGRLHDVRGCRQNCLSE